MDRMTEIRGQVLDKLRDGALRAMFLVDERGDYAKVQVTQSNGAENSARQVALLQLRRQV